VRVDHGDRAPELWFPLDDVRGGEAAVVKGDGELAGFVAFADGIEIELVDDRDSRAPVVTRFPNWGDAADLIDILDVQREPDNTWVGETRGDWQRPVVEGSEILGKAVVAAMRASGGRRVVNANMFFLRAADAHQPVPIELRDLTNGRTFTAYEATAAQNGRLCASGQLLLDATASDVMRHTANAPEVPGPYDAEAFDMGVTGRELRVVDGAYTGDPDAPVGPPVIDAWVRFGEVPNDDAIHAGLLVQFSGHMSIAAALRPHAGVGQDQAHRTLSTAVNAINVSLHANARVDRWLLYRHLSTFAGDGMTHSECRVHDEDGALIASFTNDCMVRGFATAAAGDYKSSM
jgi:acyl-CoA thioesterase